MQNKQTEENNSSSLNLDNTCNKTVLVGEKYIKW
jgi:hypothetical protein